MARWRDPFSCQLFFASLFSRCFFSIFSSSPAGPPVVRLPSSVTLSSLPTMLTASNLGSLDASNAAAILADQPPPRKQKKDVATKIYESELEMRPNLDLGLKGVSRAQLRAWVKECILEASVVKRRKYSHSALSSALSGIDTSGNAKNALKQLQKERLIVSRMGFPDRAMEIDAEIDRMLTKVKQVREQEEKDLVDYRLKMLAAAQGRKRQKMEAEISEEINKLEEMLKHEYIKVRMFTLHG